MKKYLNCKTLTISIALLIFAVGIFWPQLFFGKGKNKITIENNYQANDILSDSQMESPQEEVVREPEKIQEKVESETRKDPAAVEPGKSVNSGQEAEESASEKKSLKIIDKLVGWGFEKSSGRNVDTIIIHSSYDAIGADPFDVDGLISEYKSYGVAPHYLIDRGGSVYRLVEDKNVAYHAGESRTPDGRSGVNNFSIGIELMNTQKGNFTASQYVSINRLIGHLKEKYKIKYVLGHNQVAPGRKDDPWNFDWNKLD